MTDTFHVRFDRLKNPQEQALREFFSSSSLDVKGTDARDWGEFRGGCLPLLVIGGALTALPVLLSWNPNTFVVVLVLTAWMGWATSQLIRTAVANRRSRGIIKEKLAWHGLAWTESHFAYRSWTDCLYVQWDEISELRFLDDRWDGSLADTLWMHMVDGRKVQIVGKDGRFAGRELIEWFADMAELLADKTGRVSTRPAPVSR
ncbi:MAG: hypothetical protein KDA24_09240 [Deltaproteobacteria bacterium]|nr:hypothetical protein [Deltaproteobacteria bacterium]